MTSTVNTAVPAASAAPTPLARFVSSLKRTRQVSTLDLHQKRLNHLALNFDPFAGAMDHESAQIVAYYGLEEALQDPFRFTNLVLGMLDQLEERRRALVH